VSGARHQALGLGAMAARNGVAAGRQPYGPRAGFTDTDPGGAGGNWRDRAACKPGSGIDPETFYPIGATGPALLQIEDAKAVCRRCASIEACLSFAITAGIDTGVYGGMSEDERRALKRRASRSRTRQGTESTETASATADAN